jgi:hypothetical protein
MGPGHGNLLTGKKGCQALSRVPHPPPPSPYLFQAHKAWRWIRKVHSNGILIRGYRIP